MANRSLRQIDPTLFIALWSAWCFLNALSLLLPGRAFDQDIFFYFREIKIPEEAWGFTMLFDALLIVISLRNRSLWLRAGMSMSSGALWIIYGALLMASGWRIHFLPAGGGWDVLCGLALVYSATQWVAWTDVA